MNRYNCYVDGHWIGRRLAKSPAKLKTELRRKHQPLRVAVKLQRRNVVVRAMLQAAAEHAAGTQQ